MGHTGFPTAWWTGRNIRPLALYSSSSDTSERRCGNLVKKRGNTASSFRWDDWDGFEGGGQSTYKYSTRCVYSPHSIGPLLSSLNSLPSRLCLRHRHCHLTLLHRPSDVSTTPPLSIPLNVFFRRRAQPGMCHNRSERYSRHSGVLILVINHFCLSSGA